MSILESISGALGGLGGILGDRKDSTSTTSGQTTGATAGQQGGTGTNVANVNRAYDPEIGRAFGQIPGLYDPGRALIQQSANPTTFGQVQGLLNPYAQSQVAANFASLQPQFQDQLSQLKGSQSANPYASSNGGAEARLRGQQANTLGQISSGIYGQSYNQALGAAQTDNARTLQAGTGLTGAATQQIGQVPGLVLAGNQNTTGANTSNAWNTGQSTSNFNQNQTGTTTSYNPFDTLTDIASGAMMLSDERIKHDIEKVGKTHDGQPIYTYRIGDGPTQMGLLAQEVESRHPHAVGQINGIKAVDYKAATRGAERKADGGGVGSAPVSDFASKVRDAYKVFSDLHQRARGGPVKGFADGGWDATATPEPDGWAPTVSPDDGGDERLINQANYNQGDFDAQRRQFGTVQDWLANRSKNRAQSAQRSQPPPLGSGIDTAPLSSAMQANGSALAQSQSGLNEFARGLVPRAHAGGVMRHGYATDGFVEEVPGPPERSWYDPRGWFNAGDQGEGGVMAGEGRISPSDRTAIILSGMGRGRVAKTALGLQEADLARAREMGDLNGERTLQGQQLDLSKGQALGVIDGLPTLARQQALGKIEGQNTLARDSHNLAVGSALGEVGGMPTLHGRQQTEAEIKARLPEWQADTGERDIFGVPVPGWINPRNAPDKAKAALPNYGLPATGADRRAEATLPPPASAVSPAPGATHVFSPGREDPLGTERNPQLVKSPEEEEQFKREKPGGYYTTIANPKKVLRAPGGAPAAQPPAPEAGPPTPPTEGQPFAPGVVQAPAAAPPAPVAPVDAPQPAMETPGIVRVPSTWGNLDTTKTGPEAFAQLPEIMKNKVASVLDGRTPAPTGMALKNPEQMRLLTAAQMVDPTFDMAKWHARSAAFKEFTTPGTKTRTKIESADKVISHIGDLSETIGELHNRNWWFGTALRSFTNPLAKQNPEVAKAFKDFKVASNIAMKEFTTFLSGKGGGADRELKEVQDMLHENASEGELRTAVSRMLKMMDGQLHPMGETYAKAFNLPDYDAHNFLSKDTRAKLERMQGGGGPSTEDIKLPKPIADMSLPELNAMPEGLRSKLSPRQFDEAKARRDALMKGTP